MRHQVEEHERPIGDLYITEESYIEELAQMLRVEDYALLWDPCASGAAPYTIGEMLAESWKVPRVALTDLYPRRPDIRKMNYLTAPRPRVNGAILEVSNIPYYLLDERKTAITWVDAWSRRALPGDAAIWLLAYDSLPVKGDRGQEDVTLIAQPRQRPAFKMTLEDALATGRRNKNGKPRPIDEHGLVCLDTTGKSHAWIGWQKLNTPKARQHVLTGDKIIPLWSGLER